MISSQSINGFYRDKLGKHPTDLYMVQSGPIPDSIWSTGYNTSVLMDYFGPNGQNYIPQSIGELHDWRDMRDATPLCNALNEGSFLTLYRGHSNMDQWWFPQFSCHHLETDIYGPPTFVLSISCSTLLFDNQWDNVGHLRTFTDIFKIFYAAVPSFGRTTLLNALSCQRRAVFSFTPIFAPICFHVIL